MCGHPHAGRQPSLGSPVTPLAIFGDVGVYIEYGGEILDCFSDGGDGAGATGVTEHVVLFSVSMNTGFQDRPE